MMRRLYYMIFTPRLFERSVLHCPRAACAFFLLVGIIPILVILPFIVSMPYPWGAVASISAGTVTATTLLLWQFRHEQIRHAWRYLRGREQDFWRFNNG